MQPNQKRKGTRIRQIISLAWKDLKYNAVSSSLIVLVIAAICLPMIILTSLREGYLEILKEMISNSSQAKRIDIVVDLTKDSLILTSARLDVMESDPSIEAAIPHRNKKIILEKVKGGDEYFELVSTVPEDPDLKRFQFKGNYGEDEHKYEKSLIIHESDVKMLGYDSIPSQMIVLLQRGNEVYPIEFRVLGTISGGERQKIYCPIGFLDKYEQWTQGFSIPEYGLPAHRNKEESLEPLSSDSCLAISIFPLKSEQKTMLASLDLEVSETSYPGVKDFLYFVQPTERGTRMSDEDRKVVEDIFSTETSSIVLPIQRPYIINFAGSEVPIYPSSQADFRKSYLLEEGNWVDPNTHRLGVVLPQSLIGEDNIFPLELSLSTASGTITIPVLGSTKDQRGYMDFQSLFRVEKLIEGRIHFDDNSQLFEPVAANEVDFDKYLVGRIHAKTIEDVVLLTDRFERVGYDIYGSSKATIENFKRIRSVLSNFVLLITFIGGIACVAALFVLMFEGIKRKRRQLGIMRALGLKLSFISSTFITQSAIYGIIGLSLSLGLFQILRVGLDSVAGKTLLGVPTQEGQLFSLSIELILIFFFSVLLISVISGYLASRSIRKIDPATILTN